MLKNVLITCYILPSSLSDTKLDLIIILKLSVTAAHAENHCSTSFLIILIFFLRFRVIQAEKEI